jgi:hypothetical protein
MFAHSLPESLLEFHTLFCSSMLNLPELIGMSICRSTFGHSLLGFYRDYTAGLRPDLARLRKIIYFHENQLAYPDRATPETTTERDLQLPWIQIVWFEIATC